MGWWMRNAWRQIAGEVGSALGVLSLLVLTLLMPLHTTAEARLAMGDRTGLTILCMPGSDTADPAVDPAKGTTAASCDLCILAHAAKAFGPGATFELAAPSVIAPVRLAIHRPRVDAGAMLVYLPDARGPPLA